MTQEEIIWRQDRLPPWAHKLPTRLQSILLNNGVDPYTSQTAARSLGWGVWARIPGMGPVALSQLGQVLGGWKDGPPSRFRWPERRRP